VPLAVIALDFDPVLRFDDTAVRLETVALAVAVLVTLLLAALIARRTRIVGDDGAARLRVDDLILVALSAVPGAVAGGRLGYVVLHLDFYVANPGAVADPLQGSLELTLAVLGGAVTATYAARLIGEDDAAWRDVAAIPLLVGLAMGKVAMALGGRGQGMPSDVAWATAYVGPGPWGSLGPSIPSHPAQLYEAIAAVLVLLAVVGWRIAGRDRAMYPGRTFLAAVVGWVVLRGVVAATWRDAALVGPINAEQLICAATAVLLVANASRETLRRRVRWPARASASERAIDPKPPA
jgi:prolipoprotein diacylglyceryltransferase